MTSYVPWEERERRASYELYLDSLIGRASEQHRSFYGGAHPEKFFYDRVGPVATCYACGSAPPSACFSGSAYNPYAPLRGLESHDVDMILVRLLEGYRILDELFNPRSLPARRPAEARDPRPETNQARSD